ncbi:hypothetical protein C4559_06180 [Candidatus Microgenomates bacterium]|nr:MAG: hypothetical protein C4559_06180 [Candidatus Microgenomates bacterium]
MNNQQIIDKIPVDLQEKPTTPAKPKNILFILIGIFAIILTLLTGTYIFIAKINKQPAKTAPIAAKPSPTPDSTANWKIYTNTAFGFSVKYPSALVVNEHQPNPLFSRVAFSTLNQGCDKDINLTIDKIKNNPPDLESKVILTQKIKIGTDNADMKINELQKGEVPFHQACIYNKQAKSEDFLTATAIIYHNGFYWRFSSEIRRDYQEADSTLYNQILSTFKFTQ